MRVEQLSTWRWMEPTCVEDDGDVANANVRVRAVDARD
jgi:hypothetical protein